MYEVGQRVKGPFGLGVVIAVAEVQDYPTTGQQVAVRYDAPVSGTFVDRDRKGYVNHNTAISPECLEVVAKPEPPKRFCLECEEEDFFFVDDEDYMCAACRWDFLERTNQL